MRPVQLGDRSFLQILHPLPERLDALDGALGICVEHGLGRFDAFAGRDLLRRRLHLRVDTVDLVPAPGVGLAQVQIAAVPGTRVADVPLLPDRVALGGTGQVVLAEEAAESAVALVRSGGGGAKVAPQPLGEVTAGPTHEPAEEPAARAARPRLTLLEAGFHLPPGSGASHFETRFERRAVPREGVGQAAQASRDRRPVGFALGRHQVEHAPDALHRRGQHVHPRQIVARVVQLRVDRQRFAHDLAQNTVALGFER